MAKYKRIFQIRKLSLRDNQVEKLFDLPSIAPSFLQDWVGQGQPLEPFLTFAKARKDDLGAGAMEPHRSWLMGLLKGPNVRLRNWAATRLVEADAPVQADEPRPFPLLVELLKTRFEKEVRQGNRNRSDSKGDFRLINDSSWASEADPPNNDLGSPGRIPEKAPFWSAIRGFLRNDPAMKVHIPIYVLMAPELVEVDREWILLHLEREGKTSKPSDPRGAVLYWIATDWLLAYGKAADWEVFRNAMTPMTWNEALVRLMDEVKKIPEFWNSEPKIQSMFCEGASLETFWENPDSCLAAWGVTREALVEFGIDKMKSKGTPPPPAYPEKAKRSRFSSNLRLRMVVGADGQTKWVRPEPGYALSFFAPVGIAYALRWRFEPARVAGISRPSQFKLNMPFSLRH